MDDQYSELWPWQERALAELLPEIGTGAAIAVYGATGSGKTTIISELLRCGVPAILYTNRKMLLDQTANRLRAGGIDFGIRAADHEDDFSKHIQLASIQTDMSRVVRRNRWSLHDAQLVIVDEAHMQKSDQAATIINEYKNRGATILGFTATPLDIGHIYDRLVVAGTVSECREFGALIPARHFSPDEPDMKHVKRQKTGEFKHGDIVKAIMTHSIFGRVLEHWREYNPEEKPTLLFAPGVKESIWFAEQFNKQGVTAAHIDGDNVWVGGQYFTSDQPARDAIKKLSEMGDLKIICNRFVLREAVDLPWLYHGIFATMMGSLTSYLQSGGRLLRAHHSMDHCIAQDHGGNCLRHGSLNVDREWDLNMSDYVATQVREERLREKVEPEPIVCPKCHYMRLSGSKCGKCGYEHHERSRMVVQADGRLKEVKGDAYKPRRTDKRAGVMERWERMFWRSRSAGRTFSAAAALYAMENNWLYPPRNLPYMPKDELDWFRKCSEVPLNRLTLPQKEACLFE